MGYDIEVILNGIYQNHIIIYDLLTTKIRPSDNT